MKKILFLLIPLFLACGHHSSSTNVNLIIDTSGYVLLKHTNYQILYDTINKCPIWSEYILTKNQTKPETRSEFGYDPLLPERVQQNNECYKQLNEQLEQGDEVGKNFTFDKGHLSNYEDLGSESMLFTNISFQNSHFNQNQWLSLENYTRKLALQNDSLIVRTGITFNDSVISGINIPSYYWKRIIIKATHDTLIYIMPNKASDLDYTHYLLPR